MVFSLGIAISRTEKNSFGNSLFFLFVFLEKQKNERVIINIIVSILILAPFIVAFIIKDERNAQIFNIALLFILKRIFKIKPLD